MIGVPLRIIYRLSCSQMVESLCTKTIFGQGHSGASLEGITTFSPLIIDWGKDPGSGRRDHSHCLLRRFQRVKACHCQRFPHQVSLEMFYRYATQAATVTFLQPIVWQSHNCILLMPTYTRWIHGTVACIYKFVAIFSYLEMFSCGITTTLRL